MEKAKEDVKAIVKGQDERLNWIRLNEVITAALPRHGEAGNLDEPGQRPFWQTGKEYGDRALEKYHQRVHEGVPPTAPGKRTWPSTSPRSTSRSSTPATSRT